ncbi:hypothetical protein SAMN05216600_11178 [Pseudomonas cuatrocienegasensis]|uniref:Pyrroline-5-carboxylate reductase catalytic N-terminal domain-containing protein n=1 Tax=Pseudomonas cuatrocienegasensis TaxID=543360 RepID=A0ABY1BHJ0_9PSED|nr:MULTISPECIES: NAD(P)H-binding protein [Pseudomonas]OEC33033.1 hypothetical protein A7D25_21030 [Pseudomonas sp. 21C1]SEQ88710.1 hypothetical protein SAMN05216600_11178 [Pseudomonas cuatrocienegasensis]
MKNAETPVFKVGLIGALSNLGAALRHELLSRQHEVVALVGDLNALQARPGQHCKLCDPFDALSISEAAAGLDVLICVYPGDVSERIDVSLSDAIVALSLGLPRASVRRLLLVADFDRDDPDEQARNQLLACTDVVWTLVQAPTGADTPGRLEDFINQPLSDHHQRLLGVAGGILDEARLDNHVRELIRFRG